MRQGAVCRKHRSAVCCIRKQLAEDAVYVAARRARRNTRADDSIIATRIERGDGGRRCTNMRPLPHSMRHLLACVHRLAMWHILEVICGKAQRAAETVGALIRIVFARV